MCNYSPHYCSENTPESCASLDLQSGSWLWWPGVTRECPHSPQWPPGPGDQATVRRPPPAPSGRQNCHGVNEWNTFSLYRPDHLLNFYQSRYLHYTTTHLLSTSFHFSLALTQNQKHFKVFHETPPQNSNTSELQQIQGLLGILQTPIHSNMGRVREFIFICVSEWFENT